MGFVVEKGMPGFDAPAIKHKMSLRASVTSELYFDDVVVPVVAGSESAARHWQTDEASYTRVEPEGACDLRTGPCVQPVNGGTVTLAIQPADIPLMQPLRLRVVAEGLAEHAVQVEIRGLNMDMGLNRTSLTRTPGGVWEGETILPICSQRQTTSEEGARQYWIVRLDADGQAFEIPFPFRTNRP